MKLSLKQFLESMKKGFNLPLVMIALGPLLLLGGLIIRGEALFWGTPVLQFYPWRAYAWVLLLGLLPQLLGHSSLNWAVRHLSATFVSIVTLAEPVCSGALAFLVLQETITASTGAGAAFVLAGIYIASYAEHR